MPAERFEIRISASKLLIALLLIIIPISLVGLFSFGETDRALEQTVGAHFKTIAQMTAAQVATFIHERVTAVRDLTIDPAVVDVVASADKKDQGRSDADFAAAASAIDKTWSTPAAEPLVREILSSPASRFLRKHQQYDPLLLRITVTDYRGAVVAATHKTVDYFQADEEYWQSIYAGGRGAVSITDILYDDVTNASYVGIGMPVLEEGTNRFLGTLDALVDVSSMFPIVRQVQLGPTGRVMLVKTDGTVIAAPGVSAAEKLRSDEYGAIRESIGTVSGRQTGYHVTALRAGRQIIGFADTGLKDDYPKLGWVVLAAQDTREAFAGVRTAERIMVFMSLLGLIGVVLFGVYIYLHRRPAYEDLAEVSAERPPAASRDPHAAAS